MKKNAFSIATVVIIALIIFLCHSITPAKSETGFKGHKLRIQSHKTDESGKRGLFIPKINNFYNMKKSTITPLCKTFGENALFQRFRISPFNNKKAYRMPTLHVRKDIDCKIMSMHVRRDVDYKIFNLIP